MPALPIPVLFGAPGASDPFKSDEGLAEAFAILKAHGVQGLDSAQVYGTSEERIGQVKAGDQFTIDTKWGSREVLGNPTAAWASREYIVRSAKESLARLGVAQVDIFYMHFPDHNTPIAETLAGVDEVYRAGLFRRFGLSNYDAAGVQAVYDHAKAHGYVLPTVYQGNYNAAARREEAEVFPTLRKLGIAFYAYSPLAGGLLTKTAEEIKAGKGRFGAGTMYEKLYNKPSIVDSLALWAQIAEDEGVSRAELAYRWAASNSLLKPELGDAVIVGASSHAQLEQTLAWIEKGSLSDKAVAAIDEFWKKVEGESPLNNLAAF